MKLLVYAFFFATQAAAWSASTGDLNPYASPGYVPQVDPDLANGCAVLLSGIAPTKAVFVSEIQASEERGIPIEQFERTLKVRTFVRDLPDERALLLLWFQPKPETEREHMHSFSRWFEQIWPRDKFVEPYTRLIEPASSFDVLRYGLGVGFLDVGPFVLGTAALGLTTYAVINKYLPFYIQPFVSAASGYALYRMSMAVGGYLRALSGLRRDPGSSAGFFNARKIRYAIHRQVETIAKGLKPGQTGVMVLMTNSPGVDRSEWSSYYRQNAAPELALKSHGFDEFVRKQDSDGEED